jgi:hypothetical protein
MTVENQIWKGFRLHLGDLSRESAVSVYVAPRWFRWAERHILLTCQMSKPIMAIPATASAWTPNLGG